MRNALPDELRNTPVERVRRGGPQTAVTGPDPDPLTTGE